MIYVTNCILFFKNVVQIEGTRIAAVRRTRVSFLEILRATSTERD